MKAFFKKIDRFTIINFVLMVLFLTSTFYLLAGTKSFTNDPMVSLPLFAIITLFAGSFVFFGSLITLNICIKRYKPTYIILGLLTILFVCGVIGIIILPCLNEFSIIRNNVASQIIYEINNKDKFTYIVQLFAMIALTYSIIDIFPKIFDDLDFVYVLSILAIIFVIFCFVYSLINEFDFYSSFIPKLINKEKNFQSIQSIFPNKNSYAVVLFIGLASSIFLHQRKFHWWWLIFAIFFLINILISFCKAYTFIAPFFLGAYLIYRFILSFKEHKVRNIVTISISLLLISGFIASIFILNNYIEGYSTYFVDIFIMGTPGAFESRVQIWNVVYQMFANQNILFGFGYRNFGFALCACLKESLIDYQFAHNTIVELLGNGGIILLCGFLLIFAYLIYLIIKEFKDNKSLILFEIVLIASLSFVMIVESGSYILPFTMDYAFFSMLVIIPLIIKRKEAHIPSVLK
ncbi:MAG: hypothetical protein MJ221_01705 [Bacilli bacterium]|nr:hypothetical protein [Bacilli bacterium]